jgi:hypothetical protein
MVDKQIGKTALKKNWWEKLRNFAAIMGLVNVLLLGFVGVYIKKVWDDLNPGISLACPTDTRSHEVTVFGERSRNTDVVELFVGPQDGSHMYYAQGAADIVALDRGTWATTARLGNPFGLGHKKRPPLDYDVIAVLRDARYATVDPRKFSASGIPFSEWISDQPGIDAVASCRIDRKPELTLVCSDMPLITSPVPSCCAYNANGDACTSGCNLSSLNRVRSPVLMEWTGDALMYVELYQNPYGKSVDGFPRKRSRSGNKVDLTPGTYEIKIRHHEDGQCISSAWFEVVGGQ